MLLSLMLACPTPLLNHGVPTAADEDLILVYSAGVDALFVDAKDAALKNAVAMISARLSELPGEIPNAGDMPPDLIPLLARLCGGSAVLRAGLASEGIEGMPLPFYANLLLPGSEAEARELASRVTNLFASVGMEGLEADASGLVPLPAPIPAWFGASGRDFIVAVGKRSEATVEIPRSGLPAGVEPAFAVSLDYGRMLKLGLSQATQGDDSDGARMVTKLMERLHLTDIRFEISSGHDAQRGYQAVLMPGMAKAVREMGLMPESGVPAELLGVVPSDAIWAALGSANFAATMNFYLELLQEMLGDELEVDPMAMVESFTGVHLQRDIFENLGEHWGIYASDTTGGGGLLSMVIFNSLENADAIRDARGRLIGTINGIAQAEAEGYVRVRQWEDGGASYASLTFPGLPIPFEPTGVITDRYAFMAATPQAAMAAVHQADHGDGGLAVNPRFIEQLPDDLDGIYGVTFLDTPRLLADGYGLASLMCSGLANGTRSRADQSRDAGVILPPYHVLADGAKASVALTRIVGDDYLQVTRMDRSFLVNMTSGMGFAGPLMMAGFAAGVAGPLIEKQEQAQARQAQLRSELARERKLRKRLEREAQEGSDEHGHDHDDHDDE